MKILIWFSLVLTIGYALGVASSRGGDEVPQSEASEHFIAAFVRCENSDELERIFRTHNPNYHTALAGILALVADTDSYSMHVQNQLCRCTDHIRQLPDDELSNAQFIEPLLLVYRRATSREQAQLACDVLNRVCATTVTLNPLRIEQLRATDPAERSRLGQADASEEIWRKKFAELLTSRSPR